MKTACFLGLLVGAEGFLTPKPNVHHVPVTLRSAPALEPRSAPAFEPRSMSLSMSSVSVVSSNEELLPGIAAIDAVNDQLCENLEELLDRPYFRLYSVDILASCEYMPQELFECYSTSCEIYPVEEDEVSLQEYCLDTKCLSMGQSHEFRWAHKKIASTF
jgi:hypothetical protein